MLPIAYTHTTISGFPGHSYRMGSLMISFIALLTVSTVVILLLSGKITPIATLIIVPILGAVLAGFGFEEIGEFFNDGLSKVMSVAVMFVFAILFFGVMQEVKLFDPLINWLIKISGGRIVTITMSTVLIAAIAHLDGSGASTFLITIPALLPIYKRLNMNPYLLLLLISASASVMNMLPWAGPLGRVASVIAVEPNTFWYPLIPLQLCALAALIMLAFYLGSKEQRLIISHGGGVSSGSPSFVPDTEESFSSLPRLFWFNFSLFLGVIAVLASGLLPAALTFMIAMSIALTVNFPTIKKQTEQIKLHAPNALFMAAVILSAGSFLGVLKGSGMLNSLAESLVNILPSAVLPYLHILVGFIGAPLELVLNTDAYYFALLPLIEQVVSAHGIGSQPVAYAMVIGNIIGTFISPFSPALWMGVGLAGLDMGKHIHYSFFWIWGLSVFLLFLGTFLLNLF